MLNLRILRFFSSFYALVSVLSSRCSLARAFTAKAGALPSKIQYNSHQAPLLPSKSLGLFSKAPPTAAASDSVDRLLESLSVKPKDEDKIASCITALESTTTTQLEELNADFDPLVGLYEVSYVKTARPKDNPVGGKWTRSTGLAQKILRTRRSFQHILPTNSTGLGSLFGEGRKVVGEAINVISLDFLGGVIRMSVILRGDAIPMTLEERNNTTRVAQPLSPLAVKALFDPPRIVVGRTGRILNVNVGPKTSVLLDTLYCENRLRLGMGGTSGSRFVFSRCPDDDEEANEFRALLANPVRKAKIYLPLGSVAAMGLLGAVKSSIGVLRFFSGIVSTIALTLGALIAFSGGGIERGDMGVVMRKEGEAA